MPVAKSKKCKFKENKKLKNKSHYKNKSINLKKKYTLLQ